MAKNKKTAKKSGSVHEKAPLAPMGDRVLIKREETKNKTDAGIIIPDTAEKEKSKRGLVVAVGPGRYGDEGDLIPMSVSAGQWVYFNAGWDNEIKLPGDSGEYFLVHESDILAIITSKAS